MKLLTLFGLTSALGLVRTLLNDSNRGFVVRVAPVTTKVNQAKELARPTTRFAVDDIGHEGRARGALDGAYWRMRGVGR